MDWRLVADVVSAFTVPISIAFITVIIRLWTNDKLRRQEIRQLRGRIKREESNRSESTALIANQLTQQNSSMGNLVSEVSEKVSVLAENQAVIQQRLLATDDETKRIDEEGKRNRDNLHELRNWVMQEVYAPARRRPLEDGPKPK
jgi:hypothetical protein